MLKLTKNDITLQQVASDKTSAITSIAKQLTKYGLVEEQYVDGMLTREKQNSTFLGNGIAIPHGTIETRDLVIKTGVAIYHFPEGVNWGDGNIAYIAIGIAAKSDEHLGILKQLTKVLSNDGVEEKLKQAKNSDDIIALLNGDVQFEADFDQSLMQLVFPSTDMIQMCAVAGGLLKNNGNTESSFVAELVTIEPTYLGKGLWMVSSDKGVKRTGMSVVTTTKVSALNGRPVQGLIAIAACNSSHHAFLKIISKLVFEQQQSSLLNADHQQLQEMFVTGLEEKSAVRSTDNVAVFKIKNTHGLHARPGAMLVAEVKKYESNISVINLDGDAKSVNAKSLMKVIGLGVLHGHQLQFTAEGVDAKAALQGIGMAIESGLSEG